MKRLRIASLVAVMTALPLISSAQSPPAASKTPPAPKPVTATMTGVVKSVDDTSMVITRSNAKGPEETFQLSSSTTRKGDLLAGDTVKVQYYLDDAKKVATAVTVTHAPGKKGK
jgi:hypothetical protein